MNTIENELGKLSSAEEFLNYLGVAYEQRTVNVNRLHILKRFSQYLAQPGTGAGVAGEAEYRRLLQRAYDDFAKSDAASEKVFKVFREACGIQTFSLEQMRASMPARN